MTRLHFRAARLIFSESTIEESVTEELLRNAHVILALQISTAAVASLADLRAPSGDQEEQDAEEFEMHVALGSLRSGDNTQFS